MEIIDLKKPKLKKVLVTGGLGFLGSHWVNRNMKQYDITIIDSFLTGDAENVNTSEIRCYVENIGAISDGVYKSIMPDIILHFADESYVNENVPLSYVESNVSGTVHILDMMKRLTPEARFVHISTNEVYGNLKDGDKLFNEESVYAPESLYSASKASSELMVLSYNKMHGVDVVVTNSCVCYGVDQYKDELIPSTINKALAGDKIRITGNDVREWIHVDDHNIALTLIMEKGISGESYCIGSGIEKSKLDVAKEICKNLDVERKQDKSYTEQLESLGDEAVEVSRCVTDCAKLKQLGWAIRNQFESGIRNTVKQYLNKLG